MDKFVPESFFDAGAQGRRGRKELSQARIPWVYEQPVSEFFFNAKSPRSEGAKGVV
jgi:hypothetical protein